MSGTVARAFWVVMISAAIINLMTFGVRSGFGLFQIPIITDMGWGRETFSLAMAIQNLVWGAAQPIAGGFADKYGTGRVVALGGLSYMAGVALMTVSSTPLEFHLTTGVLIGLGLAGASMSVVMAAVARATPEQYRTTAIGAVTAAGSAGQFLMVPIGSVLLNDFGWVNALLVMAAMSFIVVPLASALAGKVVAADGPDQSVGEALKEASRHPGFILLTIGFFVCGFHVAFIGVHLPAYVVDFGLDISVGAWALSLVGLFNIVGSLASGMLGDRYRKKYLLSGLYLARAALFVVFMLVPKTEFTVYLFAGIVGLLWLSTVPLTSGLVAQIFGPRYMSMLFGIVFFSHQIGSFLGIWLGGRLYDQTGSYDAIWWTSVALGLASAVIHWPLRDAPVRQTAGA